MTDQSAARLAAQASGIDHGVPEDFGRERYEWDLGGVGLVVMIKKKAGAGAVILLLLWDKDLLALTCIYCHLSRKYV